MTIAWKDGTSLNSLRFTHFSISFSLKPNLDKNEMCSKMSGQQFEATTAAARGLFHGGT